jgi:TolB-like protein
MNVTENKAVFLSYASQDAEAVRRIAEALRASGVEVWFDQNELVGGDAWDAKIRGQITSCALFVPVVSAATQARHEGYFRLEWKLAAQRTHMMSGVRAFLLPVVIDDTRDAEAHVPDEFRAVQWTRLPAGETPPAFCARVKTLLGCGADGGESNVGARLVRAQDDGRGPSTPLQTRPRRWLIPATITFATAVALAFWQPWASEVPPPLSVPVATSASESKPAPAVPLAADLKSIAVLPFENRSSAADSADFTAGMHEEILTAVQKISALRVIGRTSVLPYGDPAQRNLHQIASTLGVGTVVEGSVSRAGNSVKIAVQLVDTQTSRNLWADTYTRDITDMFAIQAAVAQEVATRLNVTLTAGERSLLGRRPTRNPRAYELFLRAQQLSNDLVGLSPVANWERVVHLLDEAVAADPEFVPALSLLSITHSSMYWFPTVDPSPVRRERAQAALTALQRVSPAAPETDFALGAFYAFCDLNFAGSLRHFEAAQPGLPNSSDLLGLTGFVKFQLGRYDDAIATSLLAYEINPLELQSPIDLIIYYSMLRRYPTAVALGDRVNRGALAASDAALGSAGRLLEYARFAVDNDRAGLLRRLRSLPARSYDPAGLFGAYECAMLEGDWAAAARLLASPQLDGLYISLGPAGGPIALHRAYVAHLLGQREIAAVQAREATAQLRALSPIPRLQPYVAMQLARAAVFGGAAGEARQLADTLRRDLPAIFLHDRLSLLTELGRTYALIGARDEAFDCLRTLMTGPTPAGHTAVYYTPNLIRIDPCWARLKDDPRFEEILKSAKPL